MKLSSYIQKSVREGTQVSKFNTLAAALLGAPAHFFFYFTFKYGFHLPYENFTLRLIATLLCLSVLFKDRFPEFINRNFPWFWHAFLIFVLPFIFTVNLVMNNFHELWLYWEIFMLFVLISFVPNWLMFLIDFFIGVAGAILFYFLSVPHVELHPTFNIPLYAIVITFTIVAGIGFSYSNKRGIMALERNNALQALAGGIAHEMRNPLGQIRYNFDAIQQELPFYTPESEFSSIPVSGVERIYQRVAQGQMAVNRGIQVIEMILEEVKDSASSKSTFSFYSISAVTRKALDEYSYESEEERQKVHFQDGADFMFRGAENMFIFVLFNLILNALYFLRSFPGGRIDIRMQPGESLNRLYVRDNGPGVSSENLGKLFDPFFTSGRKGGTGLGLAFCKRVMRSFGGDIICNSVHGEFTEFVLSFPVLAESEIADYEALLYTESRLSLSGKRFLLADDNPEILAMIRRYLHPLGVDIDEAFTGSEVMEMIESERYDLLLVDLNLPVLDAFELAYRIRGSGKHLPVVAYTAEPSYILLGRAEKSGIQGLLSLPIALADFLHLVTASIKENPAILQGSLGGKTLLVVDDSAVNRMIIRNILQKFRLTIVEAVNGQEAMETLENHHCDLMLMDLQMPVLDGLETAKRIRSGQWEYRNIPIIGMSGNSDPETVQQAMLSGMNDYLLKPLDNRLLLKKVVALI
ncbi:ATP-binding response regulator [Chlorobium ferrooxidans]|uniref:histidine kinase n=1 Tax=Chlorobium ferrooxidans DSM 13031 TaxID=377431 RepID=Q0YPI3_9CHLB|nr:hybrid sensor histidine kinase/response regulator [Chlorobium ferrooxidans]EAT58197.1 Response regulator receiver:ATP-binding region, ATPase-like [Chlorobium ferrooxidans DSM 13031]